MVVGLAADGEVVAARPRPGRRPAGDRRRLGGQGPVPAGRRDLRPAGLDPDGEHAGVAQRRRRRQRDPLRRGPEAGRRRLADAPPRPARAGLRARVAGRGRARVGACCSPTPAPRWCWPATTPSCTRRSTAGCGSTWVPTCRTCGPRPAAASASWSRCGKTTATTARASWPSGTPRSPPTPTPRRSGSPRRSSGLARDAALRAAGDRAGADRALAARRAPAPQGAVAPGPTSRLAREVRTGATALALAGRRAPGDAAVAPRPRAGRRATCGCRVQDALPDVTVPQDLQRLADPGWRCSPQDTRRLVASAFDTYDRSKVFYDGRQGPGDRRSRRSCTSPPTARPSRCWSATGTTTSAWTRSCARWPTRPGPRSCSTRATTPRPARPGRSSASTRWTRPSRGTTTGCSSRATTTTAAS